MNQPTISRRDLLIASPAVLAAGSLLHAAAHSAVQPSPPATHPEPVPAPASTANFTPVITPNGSTLPFTLEGGVKVFRLSAEQFEREFADGLKFNVWGYNGSTPGPTIEAVEGDRIRILITNNLPTPTSLHPHGLFLPNGMDGVSGLTQRAIKPGETFAHEFTLRQSGTFMYHPHFDEMTQMAMGMMGFIIIHPRSPSPLVQRAERDYALFVHEWAIKPGASTPDPNVMLDFNYFSINGRVFPGTAPLMAQTGDRVRLRLANVSMDNHPLHLHGFTFHTTGTEGGWIPESARWPANTIDLSPGATRTIEFIADAPGDWPFHCHKTHHTMNGMEHGVPNMIGVKQDGVDDQITKLLPGYMPMGEHGMAGMHMKGPRNYTGMGHAKGPFGSIEMGGMFTLLKVRDKLLPVDEAGWYTHPDGTVAGPVGG